jgi:hypothetical protein
MMCTFPTFVVVTFCLCQSNRGCLCCLLGAFVFLLFFLPFLILGFCKRLNEWEFYVCSQLLSAFYRRQVNNWNGTSIQHFSSVSNLVYCEFVVVQSFQPRGALELCNFVTSFECCAVWCLLCAPSSKKRYKGFKNEAEMISYVSAALLYMMVNWE